MTCSERLQAELQDDPGGGPPLIPVDPPDPPASPREQELTGETLSWTLSRHLESGLGVSAHQDRVSLSISPPAASLACQELRDNTSLICKPYPGKSEPSGSPYTPPGFLGLPYPGYPHTPHIVSTELDKYINWRLDHNKYPAVSNFQG